MRGGGMRGGAYLHTRSAPLTHQLLGEVHPDTLAAKNNLGMVLRDMGKLAEAEPVR